MSWGGRGAMGMGNELRWMDPKLAKEMGYKVNPSDEAMHSQMEPYVRWAMENWPWIIHWFTFIVLCLAAFNAIVHLLVAITMFNGGAKKIWEGMVVGRAYEHPGSAIKYLCSGVIVEIGTLLYYCVARTHISELLVFAGQIFSIGGVEMYNANWFSVPKNGDRYFANFFLVEAWFVLAMFADMGGHLEDLYKWIIFGLVKALGIGWAKAVVILLSKAGIAEFEVLPEPEEEPAPATAEAEQEKKDN